MWRPAETPLTGGRYWCNYQGLTRSRESRKRLARTLSVIIVFSNFLKRLWSHVDLTRDIIDSASGVRIFVFGWCTLVGSKSSQYNAPWSPFSSGWNELVMLKRCESASRPYNKVASFRNWRQNSKSWERMKCWRHLSLDRTKCAFQRAVHLEQWNRHCVHNDRFFGRPVE
jgi:hypothetical protein